jgi:hypothetical protein
MTSDDLDGDDREVKNVDPLSYRLRHQKELSTRRKLLRRATDNGDYRDCYERDPFDLLGSDDEEDEEDESTSIHVDGKGWESKGHSLQSLKCRNNKNLSDEDEEDASELVVDFGGVMPSKRKSKRRQSLCTSDADHFPLHASEPNIQQLPQTYQSRPADGSPLTNFFPNTLYGDGVSEDSFSLSLENGSLSAPQSDYVVVVSRSLAASPSAVRQEYKSEPSSHIPENNLHILSTESKPSLNPPLHSHPQCDHMRIKEQLRPQTPPSTWQSSLSPTPSQRPKQRQEEEEDPWISQLKQRSSEELRVELIKMQHQAKCNLEKTWAATEQSRVENSYLDKKVVDIEAMLSVEYAVRKSDRVDEQRRKNSNCSVNSGGYFMKTKLCTSSWKMQPQSNFRRNYSASALDALSGNDSDDDKEFSGERSCGGRSNGRRRGFPSNLGRDETSCSSVHSGKDPIRIRVGSFAGQIQNRHNSDSYENIEIDEELFRSLLHQDGRGDPSSYSFDDSSFDVSDNSSDAVSEIFYPAPGMCSLSRHSLAGSSIGDNSFYAPTNQVLDRIALDDFDFDPLHTLAETDQYKSVIEKPKERRGSSIKRFFNLFDGKNDNDVDGSITSSFHQQVRQRAAMTNKLIRERDNDIERAIRLVHTIDEEILMYERSMAEAYVKCDESETQLQAKQLNVEREVEALKLLDAEIELKLNQLEASQQLASEQECSLKHQLVMINQMSQEKRRELDLEAHLSWCQYQYKTSQENSIRTLSSLLEDVDGMIIPSLRGEHERNVASDIIARFDDLTDKEDELVQLLGTPNLSLRAMQYLTDSKTDQKSSYCLDY